LGGLLERAGIVGADGVHQPVAALVIERLRDLSDVRAEVAVFGERGRDGLAALERAGRAAGVDERLVAGADALAEDAHLAAGVVEVVLARDLVAGPVEEVGYGVAEDGVAAVPDGQRSGRVGGDVLDDGRLALARA